MKLSDLVKSVKAAEPEALAGVPPSAIAATLKAFFQLIRAEMDLSEEQVVTIPGFGHFKKRKIERQVGDEKQSSVKILFVPSVARVKAEQE